MIKRILSLLLVAVVMFTALAFDLPVSVSADAPGHNAALGHYVFDTWGTSGIVTSNNGTLIGTPMSGISECVYDGSLDAQALRVTTNSTDPYISFMANNGSAGVDLSNKTHIVVTFYCKHPLDKNLPAATSYLEMYIENEQGGSACSNKFYFQCDGADWMRAIFPISEFAGMPISYLTPTEWTKNSNLKYFRIDFGETPEVKYFIDSVYFTDSLSQAYEYSYQRTQKPILENGVIVGTIPGSRIVHVNQYKTVFRTELQDNPGQEIDSNLYSISSSTPNNVPIVSPIPPIPEYTAYRFNPLVSFSIENRGFSDYYEFVGWKIQRNIASLDGFVQHGTPENRPGLPGLIETYTLTADQTECRDQYIEYFFTAVFRPKATATITWLNDDGTVFDITTVPYGVVPTHEAPVKQADYWNQFYNFVGWSPSPVAATGNATYKATFTAIPQVYYITYDTNGADTTIAQQTYLTNEAITIATSPTKAGYTFGGWEILSGYHNWGTGTLEAGATLPIGMYGLVTLKAKWTPLTCTITYVALENGTVTLGSEQISLAGGVPAGSTAVPDKDYKFVGWFADPECTVLVASDALLKPSNEGEDKTYYAKFELAIADLVISVRGTQAIDENQSYIFDIVKPDSTTLTVAVYGDSSVTVKDVPVGSYTVSEKDDWSWRYVTQDSRIQTIDLTSTPDKTDDDKSNDNTAYFTEKRVEKHTEQALWLGGDSYKKKEYGVFVPTSDDDPEEDNNT